MACIGVLVNVCYAKQKLEKNDKIVHNMSGKEHRSIMEFFL